MSHVAHQLAAALKKEFPSLRKGRIHVANTVEVITISGFARDRAELELMARDIESIVYSDFEGRIADLDWCLVEEQGYLQVYTVPETAPILGA